VPSAAQAGRPLCGGPITGEQTPGDPGTSQASHCPLQAALQQTPSTQSPLVHWFAAVQALPFDRFGAH